MLTSEVLITTLKIVSTEDDFLKEMTLNSNQVHSLQILNLMILSYFSVFYFLMSGTHFGNF